MSAVPASKPAARPTRPGAACAPRAASRTAPCALRATAATAVSVFVLFWILAC